MNKIIPEITRIKYRQKKDLFAVKSVGGRGGGGGGGTNYISIGRTVPTKGVLFSVCLERGGRWGGGGGGGEEGCAIVKKWKGFKFKYTCLERVSCLSRKGW